MVTLTIIVIGILVVLLVRQKKMHQRIIQIQSKETSIPIVSDITTYPDMEVINRANEILLDCYIRKHYINVASWTVKTSLINDGKHQTTIFFKNGTSDIVDIYKQSTLFTEIEVSKKSTSASSTIIQMPEEKANTYNGGETKQSSVDEMKIKIQKWFCDKNTILNKLEKEAKCKDTDTYLVPIKEIGEDPDFITALAEAFSDRGHLYVSIQPDNSGILLGLPM